MFWNKTVEFLVVVTRWYCHPDCREVQKGIERKVLKRIEKTHVPRADWRLIISLGKSELASWMKLFQVSGGLRNSIYEKRSSSCEAAESVWLSKILILKKFMILFEFLRDFSLFATSGETATKWLTRFCWTTLYPMDTPLPFLHWKVFTWMLQKFSTKKFLVETYSQFYHSGSQTRSSAFWQRA